VTDGWELEPRERSEVRQIRATKVHLVQRAGRERRGGDRSAAGEDDDRQQHNDAMRPE
jgi:hypothetical protein